MLLCHFRKRRVYTLFLIIIIFTTTTYLHQCIKEDIKIKGSTATAWQATVYPKLSTTRRLDLVQYIDIQEIVMDTRRLRGVRRNPGNYFTEKTKKRQFSNIAVPRVKNHRLGIIESRHKREKVTWCKPLSYLATTSGHPKTALASFPGSGNTWVRLLMQQMSGTWTGSIYSDGDLMTNGFLGEHKSSDRVLVVKTHEWGPHTRYRILGTRSSVKIYLGSG